MKSQSFGNFQIGMVDNPSVEGQGGFEFASGMDIFSEPGVMKASYAMTEVTYGTGAAPTALPLAGLYVNAPIGFYIATGSNILISTDGSTFDVFITNSQGTIKSLGQWTGYIVYPSALYLGRVSIGLPLTGQDDDNIDFTANPFISNYIPIVKQGGTLKIGSGRYVHSVDESFAATFQALKMQSDLNALTLANHFNNLYVGTSPDANGGLSVGQGSSVFSWGGTVLSSGSALPGSAYEMTQRGMHALISDSRTLFGFPNQTAEVHVFDGAGFSLLRKLFYVANKGRLAVNPAAVEQYEDTILFAGNTDVVPGVFQMQNGAICQAFVPAGVTPGVDSSINIGFVKRGVSLGTTGQAILYIGYFKSSDSSYHIERSTSNRQNNAVVKTLWHRMGTDKLKRWGGVKLNLKDLPASTSVKVEYRTDRKAAFTDPSITITSSNQNKPAIFAAQPRSREIQYQLTYTTNGTNTPELLSYDPLYESLNTVRK
jgi:hypothetical protein